MDNLLANFLYTRTRICVDALSSLYIYIYLFI